MTVKRLVPLSGLAAVAFFIAAFAIGGDTPDTDAPVKELVSFYTDHDSDQTLAAVLLAYGALLFLIFSTTLAGLLRRAQGNTGGPSAFAFGGGVLFTVGMTIFAGLTFALGDVAADLDPSALQALHVLNEDLFFPTAIGTAAFLFGSGIAVIKTAALPRWLGWVAIIVAIIGITPIGFFAIPALGIWVLVVSVLLAMRAEAT